MHQMKNDLGTSFEGANQNRGQAAPKNIGAQQAEQGTSPGPGQTADLDTSVMTVTSRYRHENQNSIYYLKPNSSELYILDFNMRGFC